MVQPKNRRLATEAYADTAKTEAIAEVGIYDAPVADPEIFGALTDNAGNLSPFAWTKTGGLHTHSKEVIGRDAAGLLDIVDIPGIFAIAVDDANNIIYTVGDDGSFTPGVTSANPEPVEPGNSQSTVLPAPDLVPADLSRWSWWGSSTIDAVGSRYSAMASTHGATSFSGGKGGESIEHTLARLGARPALLASSATIPESGSVNLQFVNMQTYYSTANWLARIGGVEGSITKELGTASPFVFTRTTAGDPVTVPTGMPAISVKGNEYRDGLMIINLGKNNFTGVSGTLDVQQIVDWTVEAYNYASHLVKRVLVLGHWLDRDATPADPEWHRILEYNLRLQDLFGARFMSLHEMVLDPGLWAKIGVTPTQADIDAQAAGTKPPSISSDSLHLNADGLDLLKLETETKLTTLGWI